MLDTLVLKQPETKPEKITETEEKVILYLAAAYQIKGNWGINIIYGENVLHPSDNITRLTGKVANIRINSRGSNTLEVFSNNGKILIEKVEDYFYFPQTLKQRFYVSKMLVREHVINSPDPLQEHLHKHILNSRSSIYPCSIKIPEKEIEALLGFGWHHSYDKGEIESIKSGIYNQFMHFGSLFEKYELFKGDKMPEKYKKEGFKLVNDWRK